MKGIKNVRQGFTLLELLVVVLIIGILAGIALPQYEKTVWKARFAEVYTVTNALEKSIESYMLTHNISDDYIDISEELDIDALSNLTEKEIDIYQFYCSKYICYRTQCESGICKWRAQLYTDMSNDDQEKIQMQGERDSSGWFRYCWYEGWDMGKTLCESTNWDDVSEGF